jgi:hypothetical protein
VMLWHQDNELQEAGWIANMILDLNERGALSHRPLSSSKSLWRSEARADLPFPSVHSSERGIVVTDRSASVMTRADRAVAVGGEGPQPPN